MAVRRDMTARGTCKNGGHVARREMGRSDGEGVNITQLSLSWRVIETCSL
ncbi:hypothetical protein ISN45_At01g065230 [Arabidopsis thaliana x Arabidopsis arenosa]|uniref:Uncharacterized protein n=2 Tax=Arabidopsis TaxID=3701 RepID=A0A8T2HJN5_ARASU|nr:hypothetical protein ISN45_At01g065230 [Arabidopsis thaliana x Arabidopsis arenosa]KAG7659546.1 hypothetical protein ISN44_As01g064110 [Arabidopsis suecica]